MMKLPPCHMRQTVFRCQERAFDMHRPDRVEIILGIVGDRLVIAVIAGVAEDHIDAAPFRHGRIDIFPRIGLPADIGNGIGNAVAPDLHDSLLKITLVEIDQHHRSAFLMQQLGARQAEAARAARDDAYPIVH